MNLAQDLCAFNISTFHMVRTTCQATSSEPAQNLEYKKQCCVHAVLGRYEKANSAGGMLQVLCRRCGNKMLMIPMEWTVSEQHSSGCINGGVAAERADSVDGIFCRNAFAQMQAWVTTGFEVMMCGVKWTRRNRSKKYSQKFWSPCQNTKWIPTAATLGTGQNPEMVAETSEIYQDSTPNKCIKIPLYKIIKD